MNEQDTARRPAEIQEIERHKYFLSEKAGCDVGWEAAEADWEARYADQWRQRQAEAAGNSHDHAAHEPTIKATPEATNSKSDRPSQGAAKSKSKSPSWFARLFSRNYTVR